MTEPLSGQLSDELALVPMPNGCLAAQVRSHRLLFRPPVHVSLDGLVALVKDVMKPDGALMTGASSSNAKQAYAVQVAGVLARTPEFRAAPVIRAREIPVTAPWPGLAACIGQLSSTMTAASTRQSTAYWPVTVDSASEALAAIAAGISLLPVSVHHRRVIVGPRIAESDAVCSSCLSAMVQSGAPDSLDLALVAAALVYSPAFADAVGGNQVWLGPLGAEGPELIALPDRYRLCGCGGNLPSCRLLGSVAAPALKRLPVTVRPGPAWLPSSCPMIDLRGPEGQQPHLRWLERIAAVMAEISASSIGEGHIVLTSFGLDERVDARWHHYRAGRLTCVAEARTATAELVRDAGVVVVWLMCREMPTNPDPVTLANKAWHVLDQASDIREVTAEELGPHLASLFIGSRAAGGLALSLSLELTRRQPSSSQKRHSGGSLARRAKLA